jgi:KDO2-lipid IV(A) lauroyltransferase
VASPRTRALRGKAVYVVVSALAFFVRLLPLRAVRAAGMTVAAAGTPFFRRDLRRAREQLAAAYPDWSARDIARTVRAVTRHIGITFMEFLWLRNVDDTVLARTTTYEGAEHITGRTSGMIAISGHCGNWEWAAHAIAAIAPLTTMQRQRNEPDINRLITKLRGESNVSVIDRGAASAGREMIRALRDGRCLAFLIDQNIRAESVKVPFFGRPALTPIGPAKLAIRAEVPVVCIFDERLADGHHVIRIHEPIPTSKDDDPIALTARITAIIEEEIRRRPQQWVWFHDRWRERPDWDVTPRSSS